MFNAWRNDLFAYGATTGTFLNLVTAGMPALLSALLLLVAMIVYPVAYALFAVFYSLYGTILFVTGPLVLALMPSFGLGSLARRYAVNVMIFASWGLIYGIFCRLAIAINVNSMAALTSANSFAGALAGASQEVLLAVASVLFSVCILLIPVPGEADRRRRSWRLNADGSGSSNDDGAVFDVGRCGSSEVVCRRQAREVAVVPVRVPGAGLPPHHQTLLLSGPSPAAVQREPHSAVLVPRRDRPVEEVAAVDPETSGLQTFHTLPVGSEELSLPWRCGVDKMR